MAYTKQLAKLKHAADMVRDVLRNTIQSGKSDDGVYAALYAAAHEIDTARMLLQSRTIQVLYDTHRRPLDEESLRDNRSVNKR